MPTDGDRRVCRRPPRRDRCRLARAIATRLADLSAWPIPSAALRTNRASCRCGPCSPELESITGVAELMSELAESFALRIAHARRGQFKFSSIGGSCTPTATSEHGSRPRYSSGSLDRRPYLRCVVASRQAILAAPRDDVGGRARTSRNPKKVARPHLLFWYRLPHVSRIIGTDGSP
jgi:hypothetical protein